MNALQPIIAAIIAHAQALGIGSGVIALSFVQHWPEKIPTTAQEWWDWFRATFQTALPINRLNQNPTMPVTPAKEK